MRTIQHIYEKKEGRECTYNRDIFKKLHKEMPDLTIEEILADSKKGEEMIAQHKIHVLPATFVNGEYYISGRVDENELRKRL